MIKSKQKVGIAVLIGGLACGVFANNATTLFATDFAGDEAYWTNVCSQYTTDTSIIATCNEYKTYLNDEKNAKLFESKDTQAKLDAVSGDLVKMGDLAYSYQEQAAALDIEIATIGQSITQMQESIVKVEETIKEQTIKIDKRMQLIKDRMVEMQAASNTNEYVNFLMGSEDLVEFIQRNKGIEAITTHDNEQIALLNDDIKKLDDDKKEQVRIQETLQAQQDVLATKKQDVLDAKAESEKVLIALAEKQKQLALQKSSADDAVAGLAALTPSVPVPPVQIIVPENPGGNSTGGSSSGGSGGGSNTGSLNWARDFYGPYYDGRLNIFSRVNLTGQCTWYVYGRAGEVNGGVLPLPTGHAASWYGMASGNFSVGQTPRGNAVAVWGGNGYGHVAFVESYVDGVITISEGNVGANPPLDYGCTLAQALQFVSNSSMTYDSFLGLSTYRGNFIGFIYL